MYYSKKSIQAVLAMIAIFTLASCKKDKENLPDIAAVSVVNAAAGSPALNVFIDGNKIDNETFAFGKNSNYLNAYTGEREFAFFEGTTKKATGKFDLKKGKIYSLFLAGAWPQTELVLLSDSLTMPANGKAHVRFVNMGKDAGLLKLGLTNGSTLINQTAYKAGSDFIAVNGNQPYTFVIRSQTTPTDTVSIAPINLEAGHNYTIWAKGVKAEVGANALGLAVIKNN